MAKIPLIGGFYTGRSKIALATRCANLYPEKNQEDAPFPYTQYPTPGLTGKTASLVQRACRGLYFTSAEQLIAVIGQNVYYISSNFAPTLLGQIQSNTSTPVSMIDNGIQTVIVDGSTRGYTINIVPQNGVSLQPVDFQPLMDLTGSFVGSTRVDYLDTFLLFNQPGTKNIYCSLSNEVQFNNLDIAAKTSQPDILVAVIETHREFLAIGKRTTEVWYDAGNTQFPFSIVPGTFFEYGCQAPYSIQKHGTTVFWLEQDKDGSASIVRYMPYKIDKISTPAVSAAIQGYAVKNDAVGMVYKQDDHVFYALTFPTADKTWVWDETEGLWHERYSIDSSGQEHRWRPSCMVDAYDKIVCGVSDTGALYTLDLNNSTEDGTSIIRRRGLPYITNETRRAGHDWLQLDIETGLSPQSGPLEYVSLRFSDDRGHSWTANPMTQPLGQLGDYSDWPQWRQLGISRERIYEFFWTSSGQNAMNGAYLDIAPMKGST